MKYHAFEWEYIFQQQRKIKRNLVLVFVRVKMVNSYLSFFQHTVLKIQPLTHDWYTHNYSFFTEDHFYFFRNLQQCGSCFELCAAGVPLTYICLNEIKRKTLGSWFQIEFETEGQKHIFGLCSNTCIFQPPFLFTALFDLKSLESSLSQLLSFHSDGHLLLNQSY